MKCNQHLRLGLEFWIILTARFLDQRAVKLLTTDGKVSIIVFQTSTNHLYVKRSTYFFSLLTRL